MYEALIIGGGPAGLAATMYCVRKGMDVLMVTSHMGGKSTLGLNLPDVSEYHVLKSREQVQIYRARIEYLNHVWRRAHVDSISDDANAFQVTLSGTQVEPRATGSAPSNADGATSVAGAPATVAAEQLIIATGTIPRPLGVPGEKEFFGNGLGSSAISYSHLLRERHAVIVGDSDRAIEAALECSLQAEMVTLILEPHAEYSHTHLHLVEQHENIEVYNGYRVVRFEGDTFARSVDICRGDVDCPDGRPHKQIRADAFFVEREPRPNSGIVADLVDRTAAGAISIDATNATSNPRIFAAGDVTTVGVEQILIALGEGARAGLSAYRRMTLSR
jgi:alkyl hydroperoxide reductase subunit F